MGGGGGGEEEEEREDEERWREEEEVGRKERWKRGEGRQGALTKPQQAMHVHVHSAPDTCTLLAVGLGHVFGVWILIFTGSDIIIHTWFWSDLIGQQLDARTPSQPAVYKVRSTGVGVVGGCPVSLARLCAHISLAAEAS